MKVRSFLWQSVHTLATRGASIALTLTFGVITARFLGPEGKGLLALLAAPAAVICAAGEFGIRQSTGYLVGKSAYPLENIQMCLSALGLAAGVGGGVAALATYAAAGQLQSATTACLLFASTVPLTIARRFGNGILIGTGSIPFMNHVELLSRSVVLTTSVALVICLSGGVAGASFAYFTGPLISATVTISLLARRTRGRPQWNPQIAQELVKRGIPYAAALFAITLSSRVGLLATGSLLGEASAGLYSTAAAITELLWQIPMSIGVVLFSRSLRWSGAEAQANLPTLLLILRMTLPSAAAAALALIWISEPVISAVYGAPFAQSYLPARWLLPGTVLVALSMLMHFYSAGQGRPEFAIWAFGAGSVVIALLSTALVPTFGLAGAAASTSAGYLVAFLLHSAMFAKAFACQPAQIWLPRRGDVRALSELLLAAPTSRP